jgi:beta-glucosidase
LLWLAPAHSRIPPYRDLNKNGKLDMYEGHGQPLEARITDLLGQMTLAEKAGMLFIPGAKVSLDGSPMCPA